MRHEGMPFHLPLWQTEGFLRSLAHMLEVEIPVPDHTTLQQLLKKLGEIRFRRLATDPWVSGDPQEAMPRLVLDQPGRQSVCDGLAGR